MVVGEYTSPDDLPLKVEDVVQRDLADRRRLWGRPRTQHRLELGDSAQPLFRSAKADPARRTRPKGRSGRNTSKFEESTPAEAGLVSAHFNRSRERWRITASSLLNKPTRRSMQERPRTPHPASPAGISVMQS